MKHLKYLSYMLRHKYYVFIACCKLGIPWRGLVHDWIKFLPIEWKAYAELFYGDNPPQELNGSYNPVAVEAGDAYDKAWLHHIHHGKHHWQHWVLIGDPKTNKALRIPEEYVKEMVADWVGAGKAKKNTMSTRMWYLHNEDKMILHPDTKKRVEELLNEL